MSDEDGFLELLGYLHDELTAPEVRRVEQLLRENRALRAELLALAEDEARIHEWARSLADEPGPVAATATPSDLFRGVVPVLTALAAGLLIAVWSAPLWKLADRDQAALQAAEAADPSRDIARVSYKSEGCQWFVENRVWESGSAVRAGETLHLNDGQVDLEFESGTIMSLCAPAVLAVEGPMLVNLRRGSANVEVAEGAEGFQVTTPLTRVVDLGTRFGLDVDDAGLTDVVVFEGAVEIETVPDVNSSEPRMQRLTTGEGARLDHRGTMSRILTVGSDQFPSRSRGPRSGAAPQRSVIISEVRDNIERGDSFKFYEIITAGFGEDVKAFADRVHYEWNGVDKTGMPAYLIGGDYVKTFNNDKINQDLSISVTLEQPAMLYLLIDRRVSIPDWLVNDFESTDDLVGLDEGLYYSSVPPRTIGVGPGESIDINFRVWRRAVPTPGVVALGAIEPTEKYYRSSMYGIVATPLK